MAKRCVIRRRLKVPSVSDAVTLDGKVFQARGAATKNAWSPIVVRHEDDMTGQVSTEIAASFLYPCPPHNVARWPGTAELYHADIERREQRV